MGGHVDTPGWMLRYGVNDLEAERERLQEVGVGLGDVETVPGVIRFFDFQDPDGNMLLLLRAVSRRSASVAPRCLDMGAEVVFEFRPPIGFVVRRPRTRWVRPWAAPTVRTFAVFALAPVVMLGEAPHRQA